MLARYSLAGVLAALVVAGLCAGSHPAQASETMVRCDWRGCQRIDCNDERTRCQNNEYYDRQASARSDYRDQRSDDRRYDSAPDYRDGNRGGDAYDGGYESQYTYTSRDGYAREQYQQHVYSPAPAPERVRHYDRGGWHYDCNYQVTRCLVERDNGGDHR